MPGATARGIGTSMCGTGAPTSPARNNLQSGSVLLDTAPLDGHSIGGDRTIKAGRSVHEYWEAD